MFGYAAPNASPKLMIRVFKDAPRMDSWGEKFERARRLSCDVLPAKIPIVMMPTQSSGRNPLLDTDSSVAAPAVAKRKTL